jgi:hypothetical protein
MPGVWVGKTSRQVAYHAFVLGKPGPDRFPVQQMPRPRSSPNVAITTPAFEPREQA